VTKRLRTRRAFIKAVAMRQVAEGISSQAMAFTVLGWRKDVGCAMPYDSGDWGRCVRTYQAAPWWLRRRMKPIMDLFHQRLLERVEEYGGAEWRLQGVVWPL
jgi:hypothetical protein